MLRKGEELLDNYGYHYAVMPKEERQRKLHNQYYFHCSCHSCADPKNRLSFLAVSAVCSFYGGARELLFFFSSRWTTYPSLNASPLPLPSVEHKQAMVDFQRSSKQYKRSFDLVLQVRKLRSRTGAGTADRLSSKKCRLYFQGHFGEALPVLLEHLKFLDSRVARYRGVQKVPITRLHNHSISFLFPGLLGSTTTAKKRLSSATARRPTATGCAAAGWCRRTWGAPPPCPPPCPR